MKFMNKSGSAEVILDGRYWDDEDHIFTLAKTYVYGAIFENGKDLTIIPPGLLSFP